MRHQAMQERLKDERNLRDKKFERQRELYLAVLSVARTFETLVMDLEAEILFNKKPSPIQVSRRKAMYERSLAEMHQAHVGLLLEGNSEEMIKQFIVLKKTYEGCEEQVYEGGSSTEWKNFQTARQRLIDLTHSQLAELQQPLPKLLTTRGVAR